MKQTRKSRRAARELFSLCAPEGAANATRIRLVTQRLAQSRRRGARAVLAGFYRLVRLDHERHTAVVQSATVLSRDIREDVEARLAQRYGHGLSTSFEENPSLVAGFRITVGSDLYDGSVRGRLDRLRARFDETHG
jgi:F-type H+-transporting ATPase subunit delta